jgi:hypothetical protein
VKVAFCAKAKLIDNISSNLDLFLAISFIKAMPVTVLFVMMTQETNVYGVSL